MNMDPIIQARGVFVRETMERAKNHIEKHLDEGVEFGDCLPGILTEVTVCLLLSRDTLESQAVSLTPGRRGDFEAMVKLSLELIEVLSPLLATDAETTH